MMSVLSLPQLKLVNSEALPLWGQGGGMLLLASFRKVFKEEKWEQQMLVWLVYA